MAYADLTNDVFDDTASAPERAIAQPLNQLPPHHNEPVRGACERGLAPSYRLVTPPTSQPRLDRHREGGGIDVPRHDEIAHASTLVADMASRNTTGCKSPPRHAMRLVERRRDW